MKQAKPISKIVKADKKADAAMSPAMMRKDIAADKKQLAQKTKKNKKKAKK